VLIQGKWAKGMKEGDFRAFKYDKDGNTIEMDGK